MLIRTIRRHVGKQVEVEGETKTNTKVPIEDQEPTRYRTTDMALAGARDLVGERDVLLMIDRLENGLSNKKG
jgi:hypothetical protein